MWRLLTLLALAGCFPPAAEVPGPISSAELAALRPDGTPTARELTLGRTLFAERCAGCHNHPDVTAHTAPEWARIVDRMGSKSDLSHAESAAVLAFITVARDRALAGAAP